MELPKSAQLIVRFTRGAGIERFRSAYAIEPVPLAPPDAPFVLGDFGFGSP